MLQAEPPKEHNPPLTEQTPAGPGAGAAPGHSAFPLQMNRESREALEEVTAAGHLSADTVLPALPPALQEGDSDPVILAKVLSGIVLSFPTAFCSNTKHSLHAPQKTGKEGEKKITNHSPFT